MFWPDLSQDIENVVQNCAICMKFRKTQSNEKLLPHNISDRSFLKIGIDLMFYNVVNYTIIIEYFPKGIEVEKVCSKSISDVLVVLGTNSQIWSSRNNNL